MMNEKRKHFICITIVVVAATLFTAYKNPDSSSCVEENLNARRAK